jgi:hypothetical protein
MITKTVQSRVTTIIGLLVAAVGTLLASDDFKDQLATIVSPKWAPAIQILGLLVTALGPSLKSHKNEETRIDDPPTETK